MSYVGLRPSRLLVALGQAAREVGPVSWLYRPAVSPDVAAWATASIRR